MTPIDEGFAVADENTVRTIAHRQNIMRYRSLLKTELTAAERRFIDRRIEEEEAEIRCLNTTSERPRRREAIGGIRAPYGLGASGATTGC
jgi:hypothetical protein